MNLEDYGLSLCVDFMRIGEFSSGTETVRHPKLLNICPTKVDYIVYRFLYNQKCIVNVAFDRIVHRDDKDVYANQPPLDKFSCQVYSAPSFYQTSQNFTFSGMEHFPFDGPAGSIKRIIEKHFQFFQRQVS